MRKAQLLRGTAIAPAFTHIPRPTALIWYLADSLGSAIPGNPSY